MAYTESKQHNRMRIAQEAARLIIEENIEDFLCAKQKASTRLRIQKKSDLPTNEDIETALNEYHQLYRSSTQSEHLLRLRQLAVEAMEFLQAFSPRLVGSVLEGYAGDHSPVILYLFSDSPEDVLIRLYNANIPYTETSHSCNLAIDKATSKPNKKTNPAYPAFHFILNGTAIELKLFPVLYKNQFRKTLVQGSLKAVRKTLLLS